MPTVVTSERIARDLRALGVRGGEVLLAHTSLSSISGKDGMVVGGALGVIEALIDALGSDGTLAMPAFSADYSDPAVWTNRPVPSAWFASIRSGMPAWRKDRARTLGIGVVPETFRAIDGVLRSDHPQSSFCAHGRRAGEIAAPHALEDPLGPNGPLGRLRAMKARVLLVGCGFGSCTAFHLAEHESRRPRRRVTSAAPIAIDGTKSWVRWSEPAYDSSSFAEIGEAFARTGAVTSGAVGIARAHVFDLGAAAAFATAWMDRG
jgi:aminoglycoside 3-N-acetyltransferase